MLTEYQYWLHCIKDDCGYLAGDTVMFDDRYALDNEMVLNKETGRLQPVTKGCWTKNVAKYVFDESKGDYVEKTQYGPEPI